jgi:hypothetical protein
MPQICCESFAAQDSDATPVRNRAGTSDPRPLTRLRPRLLASRLHPDTGITGFANNSVAFNAAKQRYDRRDICDIAVLRVCRFSASERCVTSGAVPIFVQ